MNANFTQHQTEAGAALDFAAKTLVPVVITTPAGRQIALHPVDLKADDLTARDEQNAPRPTYLKETFHAGNTDGVIDYMNRFKLPESALFVDPDPANRKLLGIVDYHEGSHTDFLEVDQKPEDALPVRGEPAHKRQTVSYQFPFSDEMKAWAQFHAAGFQTSEALAFFLTEHMHDIQTPPSDWWQVGDEEVSRITNLLRLRDDVHPGGRKAVQKLDEDFKFGSQSMMLTLAEKMEIVSQGRVHSSYDAASGRHELHVKDSSATMIDGSAFKVPNLFLIRIPVFLGDEPRLIPVRVFFRKASGVQWHFQIVDQARMVREAVIAAADRISDATGLPLFHGMPGNN